MMVTKLFKDFFESEKVSGLILLASTIVSLFIANSALGTDYAAFWHRYADLSFGSFELKFSIEHWINDGLMTIFFLMVGLEIERELYIGELNKIRNAALPIAAAIGGMIIPATVHFLFNNGLPTQSGFGIPMATDIAFALGMLALLGNRIPFALKIFLTALAIIDDLGAISIIAIFYNSGISGQYLSLAFGIFGLLLLFNYFKIHNLIFYIIPGIFMWYFMQKSGVHATISGVLLAFSIPFTKGGGHNPSYYLQHFLHKPVAFIIMPIFALANTGLYLSDGWQAQMFTNNSMGIIAGLLIGKPLGIFIFSWMLIKLKWSELPEGVTWAHLIGVGFLAGIGFTMSIFISNLAFENAEIIQLSKIAVLIASSLGSIAGIIVLLSTKGVTKKHKKIPSAVQKG